MAEQQKYTLDQIFAVGMTTSIMFEKASRLERAIALASRVHAGQTDKAGKPYITHPLRVMLDLMAQGVDEDILIAAVLHDAVEDTDVTIEGIRNIFGWRVANTVDAVSRRDDEKYKDFIERAKRHPAGRLVKIADVKDNMRPERMVPGLEGLMSRYEKALEILDKRPFQVGDKVKVVNTVFDSARVLGKTGIIRTLGVSGSTQRPIGLEITDSNFRRGHALHGHVPFGRGWFVSLDDIELVQEAPKK